MDDYQIAIVFLVFTILVLLFPLRRSTEYAKEIDRLNDVLKRLSDDYLEVRQRNARLLDEICILRQLPSEARVVMAEAIPDTTTQMAQVVKEPTDNV